VPWRVCLARARSITRESATAFPPPFTRSPFGKSILGQRRCTYIEYRTYCSLWRWRSSKLCQSAWKSETYKISLGWEINQFWAIILLVYLLNVIYRIIYHFVISLYRKKCVANKINKSISMTVITMSFMILKYADCTMSIYTDALTGPRNKRLTKTTIVIIVCRYASSFRTRAIKITEFDEPTLFSAAAKLQNNWCGYYDKAIYFGCVWIIIWQLYPRALKVE